MEIVELQTPLFQIMVDFYIDHIGPEMAWSILLAVVSSVLTYRDIRYFFPNARKVEPFNISSLFADVLTKPARPLETPSPILKEPTFYLDPGAMRLVGAVPVEAPSLVQTPIAQPVFREAYIPQTKPSPLARKALDALCGLVVYNLIVHGSLSQLFSSAQHPKPRDT